MVLAAFRKYYSCKVNSRKTHETTNRVRRSITKISHYSKSKTNPSFLICSWCSKLKVHLSKVNQNHGRIVNPELCKTPKMNIVIQSSTIDRLIILITSQVGCCLIGRVSILRSSKSKLTMTLPRNLPVSQAEAIFKELSRTLPAKVTCINKTEISVAWQRVARWKVL